jgi:Holliday junction resolvasome RuvABC DNA-binding subunit
VAATALLQDVNISGETQIQQVADARAEAVEALVTLGYRSVEAQDKVENAIRNNSGIADDVQKLMREVFKAQLPK